MLKLFSLIGENCSIPVVKRLQLYFSDDDYKFNLPKIVVTCHEEPAGEYLQSWARHNCLTTRQATTRQLVMASVIR